MRDWSQRQVYAGFHGDHCVAITDMPGDSPISNWSPEDVEEILAEWRESGYLVKVMKCSDASAAHLAALSC